MISTTAPQDYQAAPGKCLAWFGNQEDGKCLGYSNGQPINAGTPDIGIGGSEGNGIGISTGPTAARPNDQSVHRLALVGGRRRLRLEHRSFGVDRRQRHHLRVR